MLFQRSAAAREITQDAIELASFQLTEWIGPPNERENFLHSNRSGRSQTDDMLGDNVVGLLLDPDRIESTLPNELRRNGGFDEIIDVGRDEHAVTGAVERMARATDPLN